MCMYSTRCIGLASREWRWRREKEEKDRVVKLVCRSVTAWLSRRSWRSTLPFSRPHPPHLPPAPLSLRLLPHPTHFSATRWTTAVASSLFLSTSLSSLSLSLSFFLFLLLPLSACPASFSSYLLSLLLPSSLSLFLSWRILRYTRVCILSYTAIHTPFLNLYLVFVYRARTSANVRAYMHMQIHVRI